MIRYSDNGFFQISVDVNYRAKPGEVLFRDIATEEQLALAFPERAALLAIEARSESARAIEQERDRRISAGFMFDGVLFQSDPEARENIQGSFSAALMATLSGATPGDYRWHGEPDDFRWIVSDNSFVLMDAFTVVNFGLAALEHKRRHIFAARTLKDMHPIPLDVTEDKHWPTLA